MGGQFQDDAVYDELPLALAAGAVMREAMEADYIALIDVTSDVLEVQINELSRRRLRHGAIIRPSQTIRRLVIINPSGGAVSGTLVYGKGSYVDNRVIVASASGALAVKGNDADGAPPTAAPVLVAGSDGVNVETLRTDSTGRQLVVGAAANGAAVSGNPVLLAGSDGANARTVATDASGRVLGTEVPSADQGHGTDHHNISAATTNATSVKASAGVVNMIIANNLNAAARFLKLYNKASAPVVGTDTPVATIALPPGQTVVIPYRRKRFSVGIAYALTTGIAVADTGAVAADEHAVHINYV